MRLLLGITLILLFLWLHKAQTSNDTLRENPCEATSMSEAVVSLLLSPLSLYSCIASTLLRLVLSVPALVLSSLYHSLLLLLAWPWCIATVCVSLLLTGLHVALYLLHMTLVVGVGGFLILTQSKKPDRDVTDETLMYRHKKLEIQTKSRLRMFGRRAAQKG